MARIESDIVPIHHTQERMFRFLSDFNHYGKLMPPQVENWQATKDTCSFTIKGMASVGMRIVSETPNNHIHIVSEGGKLPFPFELEIFLKETGEGTCEGQLVCNAEIPPFIRPLVEGQLQKFFNLLAHRMGEI